MTMRKKTLVLGLMLVLLCSSLIAWGQASSHPGTAAAGNGNEAFILVSAYNEAGANPVNPRGELLHGGCGFSERGRSGERDLQDRTRARTLIASLV